MSEKRKFSQLDLIEKHRVQIWHRTRERLKAHLEQLNGKLAAYDLSDMPPEGGGEGKLTELDNLLNRMQNQTES